MKKCICLLVLMMVCIIPAFSAGTFYWTLDNYQAFNKGKLNNLKLNEDGVIALSSKLKKVSGMDAVFVWDIKEDSAGNVYLATGNDGIVYKMDKNNKLSKFFETGSVAAFRILIAPDNTLYIVTLTKGIVYKVSPGGKGEVFYVLKDESIWDMQFYRGNILIATGPPGVLYELNLKTKELKEKALTKESYITSIASDNKENIYLGTSEKGAVYKLKPDGSLKVVYQISQSEVHSVILHDGIIYAGTSDKESKLIKLDKQDKLDQNQKPQQTQSQNKNMFGDTDQFKKISPVMNTVYEIKEDEYVNKIMESQDSVFLSLLGDRGDLYIGSGDNGVIYRYRDRKVEKIGQVDDQQILCFTRLKNGQILLGTGNIGNLYFVDSYYAEDGNYVSDVLDATGWALWGNIQWDIKKAGDSSVSLQTRSGNVEIADDTWSDWSGLYTDENGSAIQSPSARFLQFRINISSKNEKNTAEVNSVRIPYLIKNRRPDVLSIKFSDSRTGTKVDEKKDKTYKFDLKNFELGLSWEAKDQDNDELACSVHARRKNGSEWILLAEKIKEKNYKFDTRILPDGIYYFKITADDLPSNSTGNSLTGEMVSKAYIIDNTPPEIEVKCTKKDKDTYVIEGKVRDSLSIISRISFSADTKDWTNIFPDDMIFDTVRESFHFEYTLDSGIVIISVEDASGNICTRNVPIK
ncbi:MAG: hypothetical protein PHF84_02640 [bacterium]|nr:hypothetical protein [bacterium]